MTVPQYKYIYGPVFSWRIGMSLGIDPLSAQKYCNFDCPYCQLGLTEAVTSERRVFVSAQAVADEIKSLPEDCRIDYFTFSGNGEPTLAANLGEMIRAVRAVRPEKVAIITNSSTVNRSDVQADLRLADTVLFKLEAHNEEIFRRMNRPAGDLRLADIIQGIKDFKRTYNGRLVLQIMFTGHNKAFAREIAAIAKDIGPAEVELNTPLRPSPIRPLSEQEMIEIKKPFVEAGLHVIMVYEEEKKAYQPFDEAATEKRHGHYQENNAGSNVKRQTSNEKE